MNKKILFIPSNRNHVEIFHKICQKLNQKIKFIFISQEFYKHEEIEAAFTDFSIDFKKLDQFEQLNPKNILSTENIGLIIIGNDTDVIPQWFVNVGNEIDIPSILIQDGLMFDVKIKKPSTLNKISQIFNSSNKLMQLAIRLKATGKYQNVSDGQGGCTKILVWGQTSVNYFLGKGIPNKKLIITGNPNNYALLHSNRSNSKKTILYAPTNLVSPKIMEINEIKKLNSIFFKACNSIDNLKVIIKPHVGEDESLYRHFAQKYPKKIILSKENFGNLITKCDCLVTNISTTVIEGLAACKPVIVFFPSIEKYINEKSFPLDLIEKRIILFAENKIELEQNLDLIVNDNFRMPKLKVKEVLENYFGPQDSKAIIRICSSLESLLQKSSI